MIDMIIRMLDLITKKEIKGNHNLQVLKGMYKIPTSISEVIKQYKYR